MGLHPIIVPLQVVEPVRPSLPSPDSVAGLVLTSRNAIPAIPSTWFDIPTWAVGDATARRARAHGMTRVVSADGDAAALAAMIPPQPGARLLLPTGQGLGYPIAAMLRARGFRVIRRIAYRTRPVTALPAPAMAALAEPTPLGVLFFSGAASHMFARLLRGAAAADTVRAHEAFAISSACAVALRSLPWRAIHVAARPTQDAMLAMLP